MCLKHSILSTVKKSPQARRSGGIRTNDLCHARADVLPLDHRASPVVGGSLTDVKAKPSKINCVCKYTCYISMNTTYNILLDKYNLFKNIQTELNFC